MNIKKFWKNYELYDEKELKFLTDAFLDLTKEVYNE